MCASYFSVKLSLLSSVNVCMFFLQDINSSRVPLPEYGQRLDSGLPLRLPRWWGLIWMRTSSPGARTPFTEILLLFRDRPMGGKV